MGTILIVGILLPDMTNGIATHNVPGAILGYEVIMKNINEPFFLNMV